MVVIRETLWMTNCLYPCVSFIYQGNSHSCSSLWFVLTIKLTLTWATPAIVKTVQHLLGITLGAPNFIIDFYHCKPAVAGKLLPICYMFSGTHKISQYLLWVQKCAYKSHNRPPLEASDHNVVHLVASYKSVLTQHKAEWILVPTWTEESAQCLQDCDSCTDLDLFTDVLRKLGWTSWDLLCPLTFLLVRTWSSPRN